ncbi:MAG: adenylosuccinate lyase [Planctomycetota bacterium]|nr:adenylosuccinate lyase [Planctomycetota bacterium]MDA1179937.1 adenylosuccinate lyase [Planctomycetota bacterium]
MNSDTTPDVYSNPLIARYASREMAAIWGDTRKFTTWRRLWVTLAETQQRLGLAISDQQLAELRAHQNHVDLSRAQQWERDLRHDVMAHVKTYAEDCPSAGKIIHWGATSCYVTDNADLILLREGLLRIRDRLVAVIDCLARFALEYRDVPCLGFTHLQPAQPTTVGKRACLWAYDLVLDLEELEHRIATLRFRSTKGTTGTQASFLHLFNGDHGKVRQLEREVAAAFDFQETFAVTGQTYSRKVDAQILDVLSGIGQSAHKAASDLRILASRKEMEEPFEEQQIGSSAMAYKRNPMRSERMCALARFLMNLSANGAQTAATQWMERTLDDSANRRLVLPQAFLAADAILLLYHNIASGLVVYRAVIEKNLHEELPFMATENILMAATAQGGDRQDLHERIRQHSQAAAQQIKHHGRENDLLQRLQGDPAFADVDIASFLNGSQFVGRAPQQVDDFLNEVIQPIRHRYPAATKIEETQLRV